MSKLESHTIGDNLHSLYVTASERIVCQLCAVDLTSGTTQQRQAHYDEHFSDSPEASTSNGRRDGDKLQDSLKTWFTPYVPNKGNPETQNLFWYPTRVDPPPRNFSPGLIPVIRKTLIRSHEKGKTQRAWLCREQAVHIVSESFDRTWGCGYRNFMMACASLMAQSKQPMYFPLLDHSSPPGVRNLQSWIEEAWAKGFDEEGAHQLKHRLVGTSKWIGTGELYVAFTYRGIPSQLVDIELKNGLQPLLDWVMRYFSEGDSSPTTMNDALRGSNSVIVTEKMPLILQHSGHSRTVVGCERCTDGTINLLVFDPAKQIPPDIREAGLASHASAHRSESTHQHHVSPSKILHGALHPVQTIKSHKRKVDDMTENEPSKKPRAGPKETEQFKEATDVSGTPRNAVSREPDPSKVLGIVRLGANKLKWKRRYQILYFPLTTPLDEAERWANRVPTSQRVG